MSDTELFLVVDTNKYAGNFERPMIAYATGLVGECGVGDDEAEEYRAWAKVFSQDPFYETFITHQYDEYGYVAASIEYSPDGQGYNSAKVALDGQKLTHGQMTMFKARIDEYGRKHGIEILGFRVITKVITTSEENV